MKKSVILLGLVLFFAFSCEKREQRESQVSNVRFTPCQQNNLRSDELSGTVVVEFTNEGVQINHFDFEVTCDFTTIDITHTFADGVLHITQQGSPNEARCRCYTDVSYSIDGIFQYETNVIFINGVQVYCYNENNEKPETYIAIKMNESSFIPNSNKTINVSFVGVSDDRCLKSDCYLCYGSKADVSLSLKKMDGTNKEIEIDLAIVGCVDEIKGDPDISPWGRGVDTLGYKFQLVRLSPYPDIGVQIDEKDYQAKIKITPF